MDQQHPLGSLNRSGPVIGSPQIAPEYTAMIHRTMSKEDAEALLKEAARLYPRMTRIFIHPDWVGILDFETRLPSAVERAIERG
jgi:hypothetical protein